MRFKISMPLMYCLVTFSLCNLSWADLILNDTNTLERKKQNPDPKHLEAARRASEELSQEKYKNFPESLTKEQWIELTNKKGNVFPGYIATFVDNGLSERLKSSEKGKMPTGRGIENGCMVYIILDPSGKKLLGKVTLKLDPKHVEAAKNPAEGLSNEKEIFLKERGKFPKFPTNEQWEKLIHKEENVFPGYDTAFEDKGISGVDSKVKLSIGEAIKNGCIEYIIFDPVKKKILAKAILKPLTPTKEAN